MANKKGDSWPPKMARPLDTAQEPPTWKDHPLLNSDEPKVVLVGDSVLDNFFWLRDPSTPLRAVLDEELKPLGKRCVNLAVDEMMTFDFCARDPLSHGWLAYEIHRKHIPQAALKDSTDGTYDYLVSPDDHHIHTPANLARLKNVTHVLVSIGGNDVYLRADIQGKLITSLLPFGSVLRQQLANELRPRLEKILESITNAAPNAMVIPVIVYHPHNDFSISGLDSETCVGGLATTIQKRNLRNIVTPMVREFVRLAHHHKLPVIDLSRTFDPDNVEHYGVMAMEGHGYWSGAEPSDISQQFIAKIAKHVVENHTSEMDSVLYRGKIQDNECVGIETDANTADHADHYVFAGATN